MSIAHTAATVIPIRTKLTSPLIFLLAASTGLSVAALRPHYPALGMTGLHFAADNGIFARVMEANPPAAFCAEDFVSTDLHGRPLIAALETHMPLQALFDARYWAAARDRMIYAYERLSDTGKKDVDIAAFSAEAGRAALRIAAKSALRLKPRGPA